ncbi:hypothetical protein [Desulfobacter latus]|uniref:Uncharacterized protein n=1 Tax=Desulfobacter latus TaxID=2292 RepID=A0A850T517_9BACT|nr:hypothetical protein [Desulfobacter latus]NWH06181.1 hypothetical protein [Desulfobacter latus]
MKAKLTVMAIVAVSFLGQPVYAGVTYKSNITSRNDTFINQGQMEARQNTSGGTASQTLALRAVKSSGVYIEYDSSSNRYINKGTMKATQTTSSGIAYQTVALEGI